MAFDVSRGQIWMYRFALPDKKRPVLILTRASVIRALTQVTVASITSTFRGSALDVDVGVDEGLKHPSTVNLYQIFTVYKTDLRKYVGTVPPDKMEKVCEALIAAVGCTGLR